MNQLILPRQIDRDEPIHLYQPRHNYAPETGPGQIYLPSSLLIAGQQLSNNGYNISRITDGNLEELKLSPDETLGISCLGAPYFPYVQKLIKQVRSKVVLGGQVINGLSDEQFINFFGPRAINASNLPALSQAPPESVSLIEMFEKINDMEMVEYLKREISLYLSNGCKMACSFCAAQNKSTIRTGERYRNIDLVDRDLRYLIDRAIKFQLNELNIYLSNLDIFQTPFMLERFVEKLEKIKTDYPEFSLSFRGLSGINSYNYVKKSNPELIERFKNCGLNAIGVGIDGSTPEVWKGVKKGNKSLDDCLECIRSIREDFGMTPESLMVVGHVERGSFEPLDDENSLTLSYELVHGVLNRFDAKPRPHVAKAFIPGNDGWEIYPDKVNALIADPEACQSLDFLAFANSFTHGSNEFAAIVNKFHQLMCNLLPDECSQPIIPVSPGMRPEEIRDIREQNIGKYDR